MKHPFFGETGRFPRGKLSEDDEGELQFGITHDKGTVILNFGKRVAWLGFPPKEARDLASLLIEHAGKVERGE